MGQNHLSQLEAEEPDGVGAQTQKLLTLAISNGNPTNQDTDMFES